MTWQPAFRALCYFSAFLHSLGISRMYLELESSGEGEGTLSLTLLIGEIEYRMKLEALTYQ